MLEIDGTSPPFDQFRGLHRLSIARSGHASWQHARHQLYVGRDKRSRTKVLIKVTSAPGVVYEHDLTNEIASLTTINRELPASRHFPVLGEHGRLRDGRVYLTMSLFDEWPLATTIGPERVPAKLVAHLDTAIEVAKAVSELHRLKIWHVDLNPMNILCRWECGKPVIRIVDFESSYDVTRHASAFYNPPTTTGYSAPELGRQAPDARADLFSLGAVVYTMLAGPQWTWTDDVGHSVRAAPGIDAELKEILFMAVDSDPDLRFASADELRAALVRYLAGLPRVCSA